MKKGASYHHGDLRRALMDATIQLIDEHGPQGFTLRAAAKLAGVSDGAPYHHFADKDSLLAAVAEEGFQLLHDAMKQAADRYPDNARKRSQAMGVAYVVFAAEHPSHFRVMFGSAVSRERHSGLWRAATAAFTMVRDALVSGLSEKEAKKEPEHLIVGNWGLVHGLAFLAIDGHLGNLTRSSEALEAFAWKVIGALDPLEE